MKFSVIEMKAIEDYKIIIVFKDSSVKIFDMKPYLEKGSFKELKDEEIFKSAGINLDTIQWSNGVDIDPELLYENSVSCPYNLLKKLFKNSELREDQDFYMKLSNMVLQKEQSKILSTK